MVADRPTLDHIVIGARTLEEGVSYIRDVLEVTIPPGGKHPLMGTHNCLMKIGAGTFLEVIATDPASPKPPRPRWFALDEEAQQARIQERPRIIAWVAGTRTLSAHLSTSPTDMGRPIGLSRGGLTWRIGIRDDGSLPEQGLLPVLIEWPSGENPSSQMAEFGIRLERLRLHSPRPAALSDALHGIRSRDLVEIESCRNGDLRIEAEFSNSAANTLTTLT
ncbi:VOC family protein [Microvirga lenta]|uniref:VOC family protein n=1 Tax=Microvirga lenta TaxID=2881337 RepID=UPI001CFFB6DE|nr:VOC family protein [Microvirga lenta]